MAENNKYRAFYDRQLQYLADKDTDGMIDNHYTADAELLSHTAHATGTQELKEHFKEYLGQLGYIKVLSTDQYVESEDSLMFEATVETAGGIARVYDVFVFEGNRIRRHFAGLMSFTPNAQA